MLWDVVLAENHLVGQLWNLIFAFHCLLKSRLGEGTGNNFRECVLPSKGTWFSTGILRLLLHSRHNVVQPFWIVQSHKFRYLFVQKTQLSCPGLVTVEKVIPLSFVEGSSVGISFAEVTAPLHREEFFVDFVVCRQINTFSSAFLPGLNITD